MALKGWSQSDTHRHWRFGNDTKRPVGEPENTGNNNKSWIDSENRTPEKSTYTKEGSGAWIQDSEREKSIRYGSQAMRRSPNVIDTNTSIIIMPCNNKSSSGDEIPERDVT